MVWAEFRAGCRWGARRPQKLVSDRPPELHDFLYSFSFKNVIFWRLVGGPHQRASPLLLAPCKIRSMGLHEPDLHDIYSASGLVALLHRVKYVVWGFMRPDLHAIYSASGLVALPFV